MKKPSKCDFKKLALLGITGGTMLASQAIATDLNNYSQLLAFNGCGGGAHGSCGGSKGVGGSGGGQQAYRNVPASNYYYTDGSQPQAHCNSPSHCSSNQWQSSQPGQYYQSYPSSGCQASSSPQYYQPTQSYYQPGQSYSQPTQSYYQPAQSYSQPTQPSQGCASHTAPAYSAAQPSHGCGGANQPSWQQTNPQPAATQASSEWNNKAYTSWEPGKLTADAAKPAVHRTLTENELLSQLNDQAKTTYQSLDASGKALALKLANQDCKGLNECKGQNSCKTEEHACAGKGSCAGTAASNFKDKNLAVKVAALKMAEKRVKATSSKN